MKEFDHEKVIQRLPQFSDTPWSEAQLNNVSGTAESKAASRFDYDGQMIDLTSTRSTTQDHATFRFVASREGGEISLAVNIIHVNDDMAVAEVEIHRRDEFNTLPKGLGIEMYKEIPNFLQQYANREGITLRHFVDRVTTISKTPMTDDRWNELFTPILLQSGYETRLIGGETKWVKDYYASDKSPGQVIPFD